jgi:hypothetical protein
MRYEEKERQAERGRGSRMTDEEKERESDRGRGREILE